MEFTIMQFQEGGCGTPTEIVGKKSLYKNKEDFLKDAIEEFEIESKSIEDVYTAFIRYYPRFGEDSGMEIESGYTFCNKGKGAFEVYCLDLD